MPQRSLEAKNPLDRLPEASQDPQVLLEIGLELLRNPLFIFEHAALIARLSAAVKHDEISSLRLSLESARIYIRFELVPTFRANVEVQREPGWPRRHYVIRIYSGFYYLVHDIVELLATHNPVVTRAGELVLGVALPDEEILHTLKDSIENYVRYEWHPTARLEQTFQERFERERTLPSSQRTEFVHFSRVLFIVLFAVLHERGHIMLRHPDPPGLFRKRPPLHARELQADAFAAKALIQYLMKPAEFWMIALDRLQDPEAGTPWSDLQLMAATHNHFYSTNPGPAPPFRMYISQALASVAAYFWTMELTERAATELGIDFLRGYPPAAERWGAFRDVCINEADLPDEAFNEFEYGMQTPPDTMFEMFRMKTAGISWTR